MKQDRRWWLAAWILLLAPGYLPTLAQELDQVLAEFDEVQGSIQTLSAEFTETTTNPMLKDPIVAQGRFFMTKPDSIRWEYTLPEEMRFVIAADEYTGYFPARKQAEKRSVQRWGEQLFRFFGVGQGSSELAKFYDIQLGDADGDAVRLLVLEPRKRRAKKRIEEVRFWLDAETHLPRKVEYHSKNGGARVIEFHEIRVNPHLSASLYRVELPEDVEVTKGFSGLPDFSPGSAQ